ncbi:hypothetical protein ACFLZT_05500, partial [Thermodesulfobacteriota bacterium]
MSMVMIDVDGWNDKYIRMPVDAEPYVKDMILRVVFQGEPSTWYEDDVGWWRDRANVLYTQDKSFLTASTRYDDYDDPDSPARWEVSYSANGRREYSINDGRTGGNTVSDYSILPPWKDSTTYEYGNDVNSLNSEAPTGYLGTTASLTYLSTAAIHSNVLVGWDREDGWVNEGHWDNWIIYWADEEAEGFDDYWTWDGWATYGATISGTGTDADGKTYNELIYIGLEVWPPDGGYDQQQLHARTDYHDAWWFYQAFAQGRNWVDTSYYAGANEYETQEDYNYHWISNWNSISDKRLTLNYQWVSNAQDETDLRPVYETYETQVKVVEQKQVTQWKTELIYEEQTIYTTERVYEDPTEHDFGVFTSDSIRALDRVEINAGQDVTLGGKISAFGSGSIIFIDAGRNTVVQGTLPAGAPTDAIPAVSELLAKSSVTIYAGEQITVSGSGLVKVDDGGAGATSLVYIDAGTDVLIEGEISSLKEIYIEADDDVSLYGKIFTGDLIDVTAGADGTGSIFGNIYGDLNTINGGSDIIFSAGTVGGSGSILLTDSALTAIDEVRMTAAQSILCDTGSGFNTGGRIRGSSLYARALSGLAANIGVGFVDAELSGAGDIVLTNVGAVELFYLVTADGAIAVENYGDILATDVRTLGSSDESDISLTTYAVGGNTANLDLVSVEANGDGDVALDVQGTFTQSGAGPVIADHLGVIASGAVVMATQINSIRLETTGRGDVVLSQTDTRVLTLTEIQVLDGKLDVTAGGTISAVDVRILSNKDANDIRLDSSGDIEVGLISAGVYAETQAEADIARLDLLNASLRSLDPADLPAWMVDEGAFIDLTLPQAQALSNDMSTGSDWDILKGLLEVGSTSEEAERILGLDSYLTSLGDITLAAGGAILEIGAGDPEVDLVGDELHMTAQNGIVDLETAVNNIVYAGTATGPISLSDWDGMGDPAAGLEIIEAYALTGSITIQSEESLEVGKVEALTAGASVTLISQLRNVTVPASGWVKAGSDVIILAGEDILISDVITAPGKLEFRAGGKFGTSGFPLEFEADTIIIEVGTSIDVSGTLSATTLVELISNSGSISVSGAIQGIGGGDLKQISLIARGNMITEGDLKGYYEYQEDGQTYYMDRDGLVYELIGGLLTEVVNPEDLNLMPVLKEEIHHIQDEYNEMYLYEDPSGQIYHSRFELDVGGKAIEKFYLIQELTSGNGYYIFKGYYDETGAIETFYSPDQVIEDENGNIIATIYPITITKDVDGNITNISQDPDTDNPITDPENFNLSPYYTPITDQTVIDSLTPVTEILSTGDVNITEGSVTIASDLIRFNAQHMLIGVGLDITATGVNGEIDIATGGDIDLTSSIKANQRVSLASTGYIDLDGLPSGGNVTIGGTITGYDAALKEIVLAATNSLNLNGALEAEDLIDLWTGTSMILTNNIETSGVSGQINLRASETVTVDSLALLTTKVIQVDAGMGATLFTQADKITVSVSGTGNLVINESDGIILSDLSTAQGSIEITAGSTITAVQVVSLSGLDDHDITLTTTSGDIQAGGINAGTEGDVIFDSAAGITDIDGKIEADELEAVAVGSMVLDTSVTSLDATNQGELTVTETDGITLITDIASLVLYVESAGNAEVTENNDIVLNTVDIYDGSFTVHADLINISGGVGASSITLDAADSISRTSPGLITGGILNAGAVSGMVLNTQVDEITAIVSDIGNIEIVEADGVVLKEVSTYQGSINVQADGLIDAELVVSLSGLDADNISLTTTLGDIKAGSIDAGAEGDVLLTSSGAITDNTALETANIIADYLTLS